MLTPKLDAAAEERDPEQFDPTVNIRGMYPGKDSLIDPPYEILKDYDAIDLPVFTCSARDYVRLTRSSLHRIVEEFSLTSMLQTKSKVMETRPVSPTSRTLAYPNFRNGARHSLYHLVNAQHAISWLTSRLLQQL
jgi:hypothetical protein